ncbi:MAG: hypothetical protein JWQ71_1544 [Pedosphaera sp.]|nr:hypothetical protein [Pedosphaera sp.]
MKLKISAPVRVIHESGSRVIDPSQLAPLDGASDLSQCFSDYLTSGKGTSGLPARGVSGGYLQLRYKSAVQQLWSETEYDLREPLSDEEVTRLKDFTLAQWSDGLAKTSLLLVLKRQDCALFWKMTQPVPRLKKPKSADFFGNHDPDYPLISAPRAIKTSVCCNSRLKVAGYKEFQSLGGSQPTSKFFE